MMSWYSRVDVKKVKRRYLFIGLVIGIVLSFSATAVSQLYKDEKELRAIKAEQNVSREVIRVKNFIQNKNPKIWDALALDMATNYVQKSKKYNLSVDLIVGKDWVESEFNMFAKSKTGAKGLGQIDMNAWKDVLPAGNPYEPAYNIESCARVMSYYVTKYGLKKGLHLYNVGEGNYSKGVRNPQYVNKVLSAAYEFKQFN